MINLSFRLSESWNREQETDFRSIDETAIHYDHFLGDVTFLVNSVDFSMQVGWIPIADFAVGICAISEQLTKEQSEATFEFTENNERLVFQKVNGNIQVTATYTPYSALVPLDELTAAIARFSSEVRAELVRRYPDLAHNAAFLKMFPLLRR